MSFFVCCCLFNSCYCSEVVSCLVFYDKYFEIYIYLSNVCQPVYFTISRLEKMENFPSMSKRCFINIVSINMQWIFFAKTKLTQILSIPNISYFSNVDEENNIKDLPLPDKCRLYFQNYCISTGKRYACIQHEHNDRLYCNNDKKDILIIKTECNWLTIFTYKNVSENHQIALK